jgi:hypothetical protein
VPGSCEYGDEPVGSVTTELPTKHYYPEAVLGIGNIGFCLGQRWANFFVGGPN